MLVHVKGNNKLVLPDSICQELGISAGDRLNASIKEGRIVLQLMNGDAEEPPKNGRGRILMFGSASEAFDEADFD